MSQVPAHIHLSAKDLKAALEGAPMYTSSGSFGEEGNTASAIQVQSPQSQRGGERRKKNQVISADCIRRATSRIFYSISLHGSAFSCRDSLIYSPALPKAELEQDHWHSLSLAKSGTVMRYALEKIVTILTMLSSAKLYERPSVRARKSPWKTRFKTDFLRCPGQ